MTDMTSTARARPRTGLWIGLALALLALGYWVSPLVSIGRFATALRSGDRPAILSHVDLPQIRKGLIRQVAPLLQSGRAGQPRDPLLQVAGETVLDAWLRDLLSEERFADLISGRLTRIEIEGRSFEIGAFAQNADALSDLWSVWRRSGFTGPFSYRIVPPPSTEGPTGLDLGFTGTGWRLVNVALPPAALQRLGEELRARLAPPG
jgi:hypothetical protein